MPEGRAQIIGAWLSGPDFDDKWSENGGCDSQFMITEDGEDDDVQLIDGEITVVPGTRIQTVNYVWDDADYTVDVEDCHSQATELVAAVVAEGGSVEGMITFDGSMEDDEETGIPWRLRFLKDKVELEGAQLMWPDGTPAR